MDALGIENDDDDEIIPAKSALPAGANCAATDARDDTAISPFTALGPVAAGH